MEAFFPLRTTKRRSIDPPWINPAVKKLIKSRKGVFKQTMGRTAEWKDIKKKVTQLIDKRCRKYQENQKTILLAEDGGRAFFKQTKNYLSKQRPKPFDVMDVFPGYNEPAAAEELANHFNSISSEFRPLNHETDIPLAGSRPLPELQCHEVAARLRKMRKPKSMVRGDLFPDLVTKYADLLAVPLTSIYNEITSTQVWPEIWKRESVTIIPKTRTPTEIGQLRNISCTMLASKVYESFVLGWASKEVRLKNNQFGGSKGCGAPHLLISVWQNILNDLEDCRAGTLLTAIDYAKAFNRMGYQECLRSLARHGASDQLVRLVATFLTGRKMSVRVGNYWSSERTVHGGVPQGSILGVLLFNVTTDNLEDPNNTSQVASQPLQAAGPWDSSSSSDEDIVTHSTPAPNSLDDDHDFEPNITPFRTGGTEFVFLDTARNVRRSLAERTLLRDRTIPLEPNPPTSAIWRHRPTSVHKYIDDSIQDSKLNYENVITLNGSRTKQAIDAQNVFRRTIRNAETIGMKVNTQKTNLLCVSDSISFKAEAYFHSEEGLRLTTGDSLKLLGFRFGARPNCQAHVDAMKRSFRGRYWLLIHMRQHHYTTNELVKAYKTLVRPIAEYCSVVFHSMLTDKQDEEIERMQATALRYIYGFGQSYASMREESGLDTLRSRRIAACDKFAEKCLGNERFKDWFPLNRPGRTSRHTLTYKEEYARCERLKNSPIFYMRRRLNGKKGKEYGQRYRHYRDA